MTFPSREGCALLSSCVSDLLFHRRHGGPDFLQRAHSNLSGCIQPGFIQVGLRPHTITVNIPRRGGEAPKESGRNGLGQVGTLFRNVRSFNVRLICVKLVQSLPTLRLNPGFMALGFCQALRFSGIVAWPCLLPNCSPQLPSAMSLCRRRPRRRRRPRQSPSPSPWRLRRRRTSMDRPVLFLVGRCPVRGARQVRGSASCPSREQIHVWPHVWQRRLLKGATPCHGERPTIFSNVR